MVYICSMTGTCLACSLIDNDKSQKEVTECKLCDAHLCATCANSPARRTKAASIRAYRNARKALRGK